MSRDTYPQPRRSQRPPRGVWADITKDPKTGHTVAKDYFKAVSFFGGLFYLLGLIPAVVLLTEQHVVLPEAPGITMVLLAFGLVGAKIIDNYLNRKTADDSGNPLVVPPPGTVPPLMPQGPDGPMPPTT